MPRTENNEMSHTLRRPPWAILLLAASPSLSSLSPSLSWQPTDGQARCSVTLGKQRRLASCSNLPRVRSGVFEKWRDALVHEDVLALYHQDIAHAPSRGFIHTAEQSSWARMVTIPSTGVYWQEWWQLKSREEFLRNMSR
ncbi:hypothetical protein C8Q80DRAFT_1143905 [Daedaleopsis nitida]|nr:hypothetical protein C8Q80DRAFT_1143905 [Daedaleopsis nitida]